MNNEEIKLAVKNGTVEQLKEVFVVRKIREYYSQNDEIELIRKKLTNSDNGKFEDYNNYVKQCVAEVNAMLEPFIENNSKD